MMPWLNCFTHPTLFIPWNQVSPIVKKTAPLGLFASYKFHLGDGPKSVAVTIYLAELADLMEAKRCSAAQTPSVLL